MGQTQILLIVLSIIIVGVAVAVGIDQFAENALTSNRDAVAADCQRIISQAMQYYRKPSSLGGGGNMFTGLTFAKLGVDTLNQNGSYALSAIGADGFTIIGTGVEKKGDGTPVQVTIVYTGSTNSFVYSDNLN